VSEETILKPLREKIGKFPLPQKPTTFGQSYTFPDDATSLTSTQLGTWMFKLAGWKGYAIHQLAFVETESSVMEDVYVAKMEMAMSQVHSEKKLVKETLRGQVMSSNKEISELKARCMEKYGMLLALKRIIELYSMQLEVISREISRRTLDLKMMQKGIQNFDD
jgi:hypothetical protein